MKIDFRNPAYRRATSRSGFTLVEIMIVVLIIGLLAMIAIPNVKRSLEKARLQAIKVNLRTIDHVKTQWAAENKKGGNETPSETDLAPYFNGSKFPSPVVGESYQINAVDAAPVAVTPSKLLDIPQGGTITMDDNGPGK